VILSHARMADHAREPLAINWRICIELGPADLGTASTWYSNYLAATFRQRGG